MKLDKAVQATINYAAKYGCILNKSEILLRLISNDIYNKNEVFKYLDSINYCGDGNSNRKNCIDKIKLAEKLVKKLKFFKIIYLVGISGSVSAGYPQKNDDIDLIIITKKNCLWMSRVLIKIYLIINKINHRAYGKKEKTNEFCFNLWLDEEALKLPKTKRNLRSAMDLILMKPILNRNNIYEKFIEANSWAKEYVANGYFHILNPLSLRDISLKKGNLIENTKILDLFWKTVNYVAFKGQYLFMKRKMTNEIVALKRAFFHPNG